MNKFGLVGKDISYSLSPLIHSFLLEKYNVNAQYNLIDIEDVKDIDLSQYIGVNVTIPYKEKIVNYLDKLEEDSAVLKSVNTVLNKDGKLFGYNTDILGFDKFYKDNIHKNIKIVGILGNSATAKMLKYYFENKGESIKVIIFSRNINQKVDDLKENISIYSYEELQNFKIDFLINTTPLGQGKFIGESAVSLNILKNMGNLEYVLDFNYNPYNTKLLLDSKSLSIKTFNGLEILVNQAIYSFEIWNNIKVNDSVFLEISKSIIFKVSKGIVIYGMPLSGKTYLYNIVNNDLNKYKLDQDSIRKLSKVRENILKYNNNINIYDLDKEVESSLNISLNEYILENSIEEFRKREEEILRSIVMHENVASLNESNIFNIIFLGGGTLTNKNTFNLLEDYIFVYKKEDLKVLLNRLNLEEIKTRPLLSNEEDYKKLYNSRIVLYNELADFVI